MFHIIFMYNILPNCTKESDAANQSVNKILCVVNLWIFKVMFVLILIKKFIIY